MDRVLDQVVGFILHINESCISIGGTQKFDSNILILNVYVYAPRFSSLFILVSQLNLNESWARNELCSINR